MGRRLRAIAFVGLGALPSCVTPGFVDYPYESRPTSASLTVVRERQFVSWPATIRIDGREVATLGTGDYVRIPVPSGERFLEIDVNGGLPTVLRWRARGHAALSIAVRNLSDDNVWNLTWLARDDLSAVHDDYRPVPGWTPGEVRR